MPPRQPAVASVPGHPRLADKIRQGVEKKLRTRLGLAPNEALPDPVTAFLKTKADTAAAKAMELGTARDAEAVIREVGRAATFDSFNDKVATAKAGIDLIAQSNNVKAILQRRAELLWAKRQALETAGFSSAEAMQIMLADIAARSQ